MPARPACDDTAAAGADTGVGGSASDAAIAAYRAAIAARPEDASLHYNLGNALLADGACAEAEASYAITLALAPQHAGALNNRGNALRALGQPAAAAESYRAVLALRPEFAGTHNNLASALLALHRPDAAAAALQHALALQPDYAEACNNMGGALLALDRPAEALTWFHRALALDAGQTQARFGAGLAWLTLGDFAAGWAAYEARWLEPRFCEDERVYAAPLWLGTPDLPQGGIVLHAEQGLGDAIQFARYAKLLRARGAEVVLEVPASLVELLRPLADRVVAAGAELPPHRWHCPLMSLPLAFGTVLATIPAAVPYLAADPVRMAAWAARLGPRTGLRVGIACSGCPEHPDDALRSIPAAGLLPLLRLPAVDFVLVQKDLRSADAAALMGVPEVALHGLAVADFADTAALLATLDLVVSVDTSVAHLAAAMALPTWVLLQKSSDFRWLRDRADSPWYPTVRLFRQGQDGDWAPVVAQVVQALQALGG